MDKTLIDVLLADARRPDDDRPRAAWKWERHGVSVPVQGLFIEELRGVRQRAMRTRKVDGVREPFFDQNVFNDELILACTPEAPWTDERVRQGYGVVEAAAAMRKALRHVADFSGLLALCLDLCGLDDGAEEPEDAVKN